MRRTMYLVTRMQSTLVSVTAHSSPPCTFRFGQYPNRNFGKGQVISLPNAPSSCYVNGLLRSAHRAKVLNLRCFRFMRACDACRNRGEKLFREIFEIGRDSRREREN